MTPITCKRCGASKPPAEMIVRAGKPAKLCRECFAASLRDRPPKAGVPVKRAKAGNTPRAGQKESAPEPVTLNGSLEISAGLGVRASIEQVTLELEQDRVDDDGTVYTHTISLAPHEARQIVDWLIEHVEAQ